MPSANESAPADPSSPRAPGSRRTVDSMTARAATSPPVRTKSPRLCAKPQAAEPKVNTTMAARNTVRAPYLSAIQPLTGMNTASERR